MTTLRIEFTGDHESPSAEIRQLPGRPAERETLFEFIRSLGSPDATRRLRIAILTECETKSIEIPADVAKLVDSDAP